MSSLYSYEYTADALRARVHLARTDQCTYYSRKVSASG